MFVWTCGFKSRHPHHFSFLRRLLYARVVELADSLDSGSSVHYARAGSSPASRTRQKETCFDTSLFVWYRGFAASRSNSLGRESPPFPNPTHANLKRHARVGVLHSCYKKEGLAKASPSFFVPHRFAARTDQIHREGSSLPSQTLPMRIWGAV